MRRRRREQTITLFAFQDIITGVAGVMLFILLLLVVQLTVRTANAVAEQQSVDQPIETPRAQPTNEPDSSFADAQRDLEGLQEELERLQAENDGLLQASDGNVDQQIRATEEEIHSLIQQAEEQKKQAEAIAAEAASQSVSPERQAILDQRSRLEQQMEALEDEFKRHSRGKLVAFKSSSSSREMWVVDLRDIRSNLFDVKKPEQVYEVKYDREDAATTVVRSIGEELRKHTRNKSVILVLRPSAAGKSMEYMNAFRKAGFQLALELLDEDTAITQSSDSSVGGASR